MRQRDAERLARRFIAERYPDYAHWSFDICEDNHLGDRRKWWSFGLCPNEEDPEYGQTDGFTGYVHADGAVEGLY